jgi:hypothetical protein
MSTELDRAAAAWDKAEREGKLATPTEPDTRPRDALYGKVIDFNVKVTVNGKSLHNPQPTEKF